MASYSVMITWPLRVLGQVARRAQPDTRLQPRRVEQADEHERQHHQQQDDPGQQHGDAEQPADVTGKGDVTEAERGHHDQRPVEAGDPRVLLALDPALDDVKQDGVERDDREQRQQVFQQRAEITARFAVADQIRKLAAGEFHDGVAARMDRDVRHPAVREHGRVGLRNPLGVRPQAMFNRRQLSFPQPRMIRASATGQPSGLCGELRLLVGRFRPGRR